MPDLMTIRHRIMEKLSADLLPFSVQDPQAQGV